MDRTHHCCSAQLGGDNEVKSSSICLASCKTVSGGQLEGDRSYSCERAYLAMIQPRVRRLILYGKYGGRRLPAGGIPGIGYSSYLQGTSPFTIRGVNVIVHINPRMVNGKFAYKGIVVYSFASDEIFRRLHAMYTAQMLAGAVSLFNRLMNSGISN